MKLDLVGIVGEPLESPPARRRGLKRRTCSFVPEPRPVASRAEAWVETSVANHLLRRSCVASRAEAWVETCSGGAQSGPPAQVASRAEAWVETQAAPSRSSSSSWSPPARRRGLKQAANGISRPDRKSPPARRRGLKRGKTGDYSAAYQSPPARRRGLKHPASPPCLLASEVASRAEAWVETATLTVQGKTAPRRLPRGGVG